jgi:tetratricopeptide (TPR) repeat protein
MTKGSADGKWVARAVVLIAVLLAVVYLRALDNPLLESDRAVLLEGEHLGGPGSAVELFVSSGAESGSGTGVYAPLSGLSLATDRLLWGASPRGWRITTLSLHGASAILLFLILVRIGLSGTFALLAALLFALHPIHTQTINVISSRGHILSGTFTLAAVLFFARALGAERPGWRRNVVAADAWWSLGFFVAALFSGLEALVFPLVCLFWPWLAKRRYPYWSFYSGLGVALCAYLVLGVVAGAPLDLGRALWGGAAGFKVIQLVLVPVGQMVYHPLGVLWSWADGRFMAGLGLAAAIAVISVLARGRHPALPLCLGFTFCALLAGFLGFAREGVLEETGLYLVTAGVCGFVAAAFEYAGSVRILKQGLVVILVVFVAAAGFGSSARCAVWKDAERVWLEILEKHPSQMSALARLVAHYREIGLSEKAAALVAPKESDELSIAAQLNNEGVTLMDGGRLEEAAQKFEEAIRTWPDFGDAHFNLGVVYHSMGQADSAEASFRRTLEADPTYAKAHYNLGIICDRRGDFDSAEAEYRAAVRLDPLHAQGWANLGVLEGKRGRFEEAIPFLERALEIESGLLQARFNLAFAYERVDVERAKEQWRIYLDQARARGMNPATIEQIERRLQNL